MGYGENDEMVLGAIIRAPEPVGFLALSIQWVKSAFNSKPASIRSAPDYSKQPKACDLQAAISYNDKGLMSGHVSIPAELHEDFYQHAAATALTCRQEVSGFQGDNPYSIWANMGAKEPHHE